MYNILSRWVSISIVIFLILCDILPIENTPQEVVVKKGRQRKAQRARCIRSYRRIACQNHGECPFCREQINAGDEYEGSVYINGIKLWVVKEHSFCLPWDEDEIRKLDEELSESESEDLAEAA